MWDGEITGMRRGLDSLAVAPFVVLLDSRAAIASVINAVACGHARSADLRAVIDLSGNGPLLELGCALGGSRPMWGSREMREWIIWRRRGVW